MSARLPSWFWLFVCVASFAGSALAWRLERPAKASALQPPPAEAAANDEPAEPRQAVPPTVAPEPAPTQVPPAAPPQVSFAAAMPNDGGSGIKVLRCVIRGRVTYVDVAATCADGSLGKVTLLPR